MWVVDWKKLQMQACRLQSHTVDVTPPQAATKIMVGMAEWRNGGMAGMAVRRKEWQNRRMAEMATYVLFTVDTHRRRRRWRRRRQRRWRTLIFYSIDSIFWSVWWWSREFSDYQVVHLKKLYLFCNLHTRRELAPHFGGVVMGYGQEPSVVLLFVVT